MNANEYLASTVKEVNSPPFTRQRKQVLLFEDAVIYGDKRVEEAQKPVYLEDIAESVHNAWWAEKIKQNGGCQPDHPDAIPYDELADNIKEYDRQTAIVVLNAAGVPYLCGRKVVEQ